MSRSIVSFLGKPDKMNIAELFSSVLDQFLVLLRIGEALFDGTPFHTCLMAKNPLHQFIDDASALLFFQDKLYLGLPVDGMMCHREFITSVNRLIVVGEAVVLKTSPFALGMSKFKEKILALRQAKFEVELRSNNSSRPVPFGLVLHGDPGIGKGRLLPFISAIWSRVKGRKYDDSHIFHRTIMSEYWENYQPFSQPIIHYSEVGSMHRDLAKSKGDAMASEVCSLVDSLPFYPNMAFGDKGAISAQPEFVIVDTNNPGFNLEVLVANKAAHQRRFLYVEPIVMPEYRVDGSTALDPNKSFDSLDDKIMNRWMFRVYYYRPVSVTKAEVVMLMHGTEKDDIFALVQLLDSLFKKHIRNQESIVNKSKDVELGHYFSEYADVDCDFWADEEDVKCEANYEVLAPFDPIEADVREDFINAMYIERQGDMEGIPRDVRNVIADFGIVAKWKRSLYTHVINVGSAISSDYVNELRTQSTQWLIMFASNGAYLLGVFLMYLLAALIPSPNLSLPKRLSLVAILCYKCVSMTMMIYILPIMAMLFMLQSHFVTRIMLQVARERLRGQLRHRYEYFLHLIGFNVNYNPFESPWWRTHRAVTIALSVIVSSFGVAYYVTTKHMKKKQKKKDLDEYFEAESFGAIDKTERDMGCGRSFKRLATKDHSIWNVKQIVVPTATFTDTADVLSKAFERNSRQVRVCLSDGEVNTYIFGICGNFAVINTHALGHTETVLIRVSNIGVDKDKNRVWYDTLLTSSDRIDLGNDVTLIRVKMTQFRDVRPHLCSEFVPQRSVSGFFDNVSVRINALVLGAYHMCAKTGDFFVDSLYRYEFPGHAFGDCGKPLFMAAPCGSVFAGIHAGGKGSDGFSVPVLRKDIELGIEELSKDFVPLNSEGSIIAELEFSDPVPKSPVHFIPLQGINYYGKLKNSPALVKGVSRLVNSKMGDDIRDLFYDQFEYIPSVVFGKPMMMPQNINGVYVSPYNVFLSKLASQKGALDSIILARCVNEYTSRIVTLLRERGVDRLNPLDMATAINGDCDDAFFRRINVTTAAGFGFPGKKSKYLPIVCEEPLIRAPTIDVEEKISSMFSAYEKESSHALIFNVSLKDEARDERKIKSGKTRPFYVIPLEGLVVSRMMLSPFYTLMVQHGDIFGTAVGINIVSTADVLLGKLLSRSPYIMEGDYGNFDQCMPFDIGWAAYTVIWNVLKEFGYNDAALNCLRGLITDLLHPYINVCSDIFSVPGLQPSGMYGTAENNSLRGVIMLMYAFYNTKGCEALSFFDCVTPVTYGDDVLASVDEKVSDVFNNLTYATFCEQVYKLTYTSAAKDETLKKFVTVKECSFLKRQFVYREDLNFTTALLNLDSVVKSLEWYIPSKSITTEEQMKATLVSALWELATRTTRRQYEYVSNRLMRMVADKFSQGVEFEVPTWDEIISRVKDC